MDKKHLRYGAIWLTCGLVGAIAVPRLWRLAVEYIFLPTGYWFFIVFMVGWASFLSGTLVWLYMPTQVRRHLDNFTLQVGVRVEAMEGRLADRLGELRLLFEQHLANKDQEAIAGHESLMAESLTFFLGNMIADTHLAAGQCKVCGGKHPKASTLGPGDPALYSYEAHGKLKDGKPCPVPFLYKLAQDRNRIQDRISHNT